jgi:hypothetical protein
MEESSLYLQLAEPAPEGEPGRTPETRAKETVDNDVESLALDLLAAEVARGRTNLTATKETIDNDREASAWLELLASS